MRPTVTIGKSDFNTGVVRPGAEGVAAIIAPAEKGTANVAVACARVDLGLAEFGHGPLMEDAAYLMPVSGKPTLLVRGTATTAGAYSAITEDNAGSSTVTAGASTPLDDFDVVVEFLASGTIGVAGITYRTSLNGGQTFGKTKALGTANTITITDDLGQPTGVGIALGAGTVTAPCKATFKTTAPQLIDADIVAALEALRVTSSTFDAVYIDMVATANTVSVCQAWLNTLGAAKGRFKTIVLTARPRGAAESETAYKDALAGIFDAAVGIDIVVAADVADVASNIRGISQARRAGLFVMARGMGIDIGTDPAWVALGPIAGARITDTRNNPKYHNELLYPGLDDLRLATFTTIEENQGVYLTNAPLLSPAGSDYVYWQHARVMNRGCEIAHQVLTRQLSKGVQKEPKPGPNGERYIDEEEATNLESLANDEIRRVIVTPGRADDMRLIISRTDDISSNQGATISCELQSVALAYIKKFTVTAKYVKTIATAATGT